jgi:hypothetical protein
MSQAAATDATLADDDKPLPKRRHQIPMAKKMQAPRYSYTFLLKALKCCCTDMLFAIGYPMPQSHPTLLNRNPQL